MSLSWPNKDPDEVLDYQIDWTDRLASDTILSSSWTVPAGITKDSDTFGSTSVIIWLSDGAAGETYSITNRIVTAGGRTMDQSVRLRIKDK